MEIINIFFPFKKKSILEMYAEVISKMRSETPSVLSDDGIWYFIDYPDRMISNQTGENDGNS